MSTVVVRYTPKADRADENQKLVEAVFAELAESRPEGFSYATFRLEEGTFVHVALTDGDTSPLSESAAFAAFQEGLPDRCEPGKSPNPQPATVVGSYRFFDRG